MYPDMTEEEVTHMFNTIDIDNNNAIDYSEWVNATISRQKVLTESNLKHAFELFDEDGDGKISVDEVKHILGQGKKVSMQVWKEVIDEADENGDGFIDFTEFTHMMNRFVE